MMTLILDYQLRRDGGQQHEAYGYPAEAGYVFQYSWSSGNLNPGAAEYRYASA